MQVVPLDSALASDAARLVVERHARLAARDPALVPMPPGSASEAVSGLAADGLAVVALEGGAVVGLLGARALRLWGRPGIFVPEWANAAATGGDVGPLYAAAAERWAAIGAVTHAVMIDAEAEIEWAWHALGFGRVATHAVREIGTGDTGGVRRCDADDADVLAAFDLRLWEHLAAPPVLRIHPEPGPTEIDDVLRDPDRAVWIAERDGDPAGFLVAGLDADDAPAILRGGGIGHVLGAYVTPEARSGGIARRLVGAAGAWLLDRGRGHVAVEYESANVEGSRAWIGMGFRPVVHGLVRRTR
ncbi:MAG: GNAT family N-acetyltransferase [Acidimicrobiia bacterium]|nr:GNAT family N-acetyltransferase [Acidimicrobiia bacterium]